jgi:hypothetical protein
MQVEREQAEEAVRELRRFISLYEDAELPPDSRIAHHLEAAQRAVAGYDEVEQKLTVRTG